MIIESHRNVSDLILFFLSRFQEETLIWIFLKSASLLWVYSEKKKNKIKSESVGYKTKNAQLLPNKKYRSWLWLIAEIRQLHEVSLCLRLKHIWNRRSSKSREKRFWSLNLIHFIKKMWDAFYGQIANTSWQFWFSILI